MKRNPKIKGQEVNKQATVLDFERVIAFGIYDFVCNNHESKEDCISKIMDHLANHRKSVTKSITQSMSIINS